MLASAHRAEEDGRMSVVKINVLEVPAERAEELERRFAGRAGAVEHAEGFEGFELLRPVDGTDRYLVYTRWRSEADFQRWVASEAFGHAPRRAVASGAQVWSFEVVQQTRPGAGA
jgi:heme oxygenase (mycobilin-producing)